MKTSAIKISRALNLNIADGVIKEINIFSSDNLREEEPTNRKQLAKFLGKHKLKGASGIRIAISVFEKRFEHAKIPHGDGNFSYKMSFSLICHNLNTIDADKEDKEGIIIDVTPQIHHLIVEIITKNSKKRSIHFELDDTIAGEKLLEVDFCYNFTGETSSLRESPEKVLRRQRRQRIQGGKVK